jgi:hypothetical protein
LFTDGHVDHPLPANAAGEYDLPGVCLHYLSDDGGILPML